MITHFSKLKYIMIQSTMTLSQRQDLSSISAEPISRIIGNCLNYLAFRLLASCIDINQTCTTAPRQFLMHKEILQYLSTPKKPTPRLSFTRYYSRSAAASPTQSKESERPKIDPFLISKIDTIVPRKIHRHLKGKTNNVQRAKTEESQLTYQLPAFNNTFSRLRKKSLRKVELQALAEERMHRRCGGVKPKEKVFFQWEEVRWAEKKWGGAEKVGHYSEKLHPVCEVYQEIADRVVSNRRAPPDPFEGYQTIDF